MPDVKYEISENDKKKFINPYNFVSINLKNTERENIISKSGEKLTGVLKCRIIPKTPIAIPDTYIEENEHKTYDFFHYDGKPIIPGSTLRGAIRSVYETLSDSCFSTTKEKTVITNRTKQAFKAGVLLKEDGEWKLYPAVRYIIKMRDQTYRRFNSGPRFSMTRNELIKIGYGKKVNIQPVKNGDTEYKRGRFPVGKYVENLKPFSEENKSGWLTGYLYIGEIFSRKHFESVFYINDNTKPLDIPDSNMKYAFDKLKEVYKIYNENVKKEAQRSDTKKEITYVYKGYEDAEKNGAIPVWYQFEGKDVKLSLACIGRYSYNKNMGAAIGNKAPCKKRNNVCKACALFGMASDESIGSRVRISDAEIISESGFFEEKPAILKELASPKISYLPFYTKKPGDTKNWSYDNTEIRGRKYYWHSINFIQDTEKTNRNSTMQLLKPCIENSFTFNIFYDEITEEQLNELIWTLTLGENKEDSTLCYKIGHGKPIGLGSAKIIIDKNIVRNIKNGYSVDEKTIPENLEKSPFDKNLVSQVLKIMDMKTTEKKNVSYPYVFASEGTNVPENDKTSLASLKWFSENYKLGGSPTKMLPDILSADKILLNPYEMSYSNNTAINYRHQEYNNRISQNINIINSFDKDIVSTAFVTHIDKNKDVYIKLENGTEGMLNNRKKYDNIKVNDKISVKFFKEVQKGKKIYNIIK